MYYAELQTSITAYLGQQQYDKALPKWELVQKAIDKLSLNELQEHINQAHIFSKHFLAASQSAKADDIYERLKKACLQLNQFGLLEQVQFYQAVADNYETHGKDAEAITYYIQGLYLGEHDNRVDYINLFAAKLNQLHNRSFAKLIASHVQPQIETAKSLLHVSKQQSLEEFTTNADRFLLLATILEQEHQWALAITCYETVVGHAERLAQSYPVQPLIAKITELSRYDRGEVKPVEIPRWQIYRGQLQQLRQRFFEQKNAQSVMMLQAGFSRGLKNLLAEVLKQIEALIGEKPCEFCFVVLGSLAREDACPYSDIDFALLVSDESKRHDQYFQTLIQLFSLTVNLIGEPNGLAIDSGDLGYLTGEDKICLNTPLNLSKIFSLSKYQDILNQPETHALHRPVLLYASIGGEKLLIEYRAHLQTEWAQYRLQWVSGYSRLHYDTWQVLSKKVGGKNAGATVDLKEEYLRPLLLWCSDIALQAGIDAVCTSDLLSIFASRKILDADFLRELTLALETIQKLRIELQLKSHSQEEKVDVLKNMTAGLELERIRSQVLMPAYNILLGLESDLASKLEECDPVTVYLMEFAKGVKLPSVATPTSSTSSTSLVSTSNSISQKVVSVQSAELAIQIFTEVISQRAIGGIKGFQQTAHLFPENPSTAVTEDDFEIFERLLLHTELITRYKSVNRKIYSMLSPEFRAYYLQRFEAADKIARDLFLDDLYRCPDAAGLRKSSEQQMTSWEATLLSITEPVSQTTQSLTVTFEWFTHNGQKEQRVLKPYYVEQVWGSQGKLGGHDKLSDGRRLVRPLQDPTGKLVAYIKVYPELPGIQLSVNSLAQHISGEGMKSTVVKATVVAGVTPTSTTYPLLLSEPVPGKTLQQILREQGNLNEIEKKLARKSFTLKFLESVIVSPEDDKGDNLVAEPIEGKVHRIISVDSDHAYVDPLVQTGTVVNRQEKVQVKSLLYCMDAMRQALDPEAIEEFLLLDPFQVLSDWLADLHVYNQRYIGDRQLGLSGLFTEQELLKYTEGKNFSFLQVFFEPGWITGMYEKFLRLQAALRENPPNSHLEMLTLIEPRLAVYYEKVFAEHKTAHERFQALPTEYETITERQTSTVRYQSTLRTKEKVLKSITIVDQKKKKDLKVALRDGSLFTPDKAQKIELRMTYERYQHIQDIRAQVMEGTLDAFAQIDYGNFFKEKIINSLDFRRPPPPPPPPSQLLSSSSTRGGLLDQIKQGYAILPPQNPVPLQNPVFVRTLLQSLVGISFFSLSLAGCVYLTDELLQAIIKGSPNLRELDVSDCTQLTDASFFVLAKYCKHLVKLTMGNTGLVVIDQGLTRSIQFVSLRKLRLPNCEKLASLTIDAPQLEELQISGCKELDKLKFKAGRPKFVEIKDSVKLEAQRARVDYEMQEAIDGNNLVKVRSLLAIHSFCVNDIIKSTDTIAKTYLQLAIFRGHFLIVQTLISSGADVNLLVNGYTPLCFALAILSFWRKESDINIFQLLLEAGANVNQKSGTQIPLVEAVAKEMSILVRLLLQAGAKVDQTDSDGRTALLKAAASGFVEEMQMLLAAGAPVEQADKEGKTPLYAAAENGHVEAVKMLLCYQRNLDQKALFDMTINIPKVNKNTSIIDLFNEYFRNPAVSLQRWREEMTRNEKLGINESINVNIAFRGTTKAGASALLFRYRDNSFNDKLIAPISFDNVSLDNINIEVIHKEMEIPPYKTILRVSYTQPFEKFLSRLPQISPDIFRGKKVIVWVIDILDKSQLALIAEISIIFQQFTPKNIPHLLVGNKIDCAENRKISYQDATVFKDKMGMVDYLECSAKTGEGINEVFEYASRLGLEYHLSLKGITVDFSGDYKRLRQFTVERHQTQKLALPSPAVSASSTSSLITQHSAIISAPVSSTSTTVIQTRGMAHEPDPIYPK